MGTIEWRKSSRCTSGTCVEVAEDRGVILVRASGEPQEEVAFTRDEWATFLVGAKLGEFDFTP